jgi:hypothetical protein
MSDDVVDRRCREVFGLPMTRGALFYQWPAGLRFELNSGGTTTQMFFQAMQRATAVIETAFGEKRRILLDLAFRSDQPGQPTDALFGPLWACGFTPPKHVQRRDVYDDARECHLARVAVEVATGSAELHATLWAALSQEIGVKPTARVDVYLLDFERRLIAHPYDGRGMDLVSSEPTPLRNLYHQFHDWLLDYDRIRMDAQFR